MIDARLALVTVGIALPEEREAAFRLIFQQASADDRQFRVANALELVRQGELNPEGILVARSESDLVGALVCTPVPGASALVWPPQALADGGQEWVEDRLVEYASTWLRQCGARLAQALLIPKDVSLAAPLQRNGFKHITSLWYMRHNLDRSQSLQSEDQRLTYQTYRDGDPALFQRTLLRTYEATLDCPEVNGVRTIDEIIAGHQTQGRHDPARWWLGLEEGRPAGVLLVTEVPEWHGWDLSYIGVVPEARRRGVGRDMTRKAVREARAAGKVQLTLSVDTRNQPAWNLYRNLGFDPYDQREVYLAIWSPSEPPARS
jgi:ribosomal protein S18 acetylase RimI-like enzyme